DTCTGAASVTLAFRVRTTFPFDARVPIDQTPVSGSYLLAATSDETNVSPAGRAAVTATPVASTGPLLVTVTLTVTTSPRLGLIRSTVARAARSTAGPCGVPSTAVVSAICPGSPGLVAPGAGLVGGVSVADWTGTVGSVGGSMVGTPPSGTKRASRNSRRRRRPAAGLDRLLDIRRAPLERECGRAPTRGRSFVDVHRPAGGSDCSEVAGESGCAGSAGGRWRGWGSRGGRTPKECPRPHPTNCSKNF